MKKKGAMAGQRDRQHGCRMPDSRTAADPIWNKYDYILLADFCLDDLMVFYVFYYSFFVRIRANERKLSSRHMEVGAISKNFT